MVTYLPDLGKLTKTFNRGELFRDNISTGVKLPHRWSRLISHELEPGFRQTNISHTHDVAAIHDT